MAVDHVEFVKTELKGILRPGEEVQSIGVTMGSKSFLMTMFILKRLRRWYYTIYTDQRIILIRAKTGTSLFGTRPKPGNRGVESAELSQLKTMAHSQTLASLLVTLLFGIKAYVIGFEGGPTWMLMVKKKVKGFPDQSGIFDSFIALLGQAKQLTVVN